MEILGIAWGKVPYCSKDAKDAKNANKRTLQRQAAQPVLHEGS